MKRPIFAGISCLFMVGCTSLYTEYDNLQLIDKSKLSNVESWQLDDIYKEVSVVTLETTEKSLFADILQTISTDTNIFVRAAYSSESNDAAIWQFDSNGKFVRQLGAVGEGPGEYNSIRDIVLRNDTLFAFDGYNMNVHLYDANTGCYLYSSAIDEFEPLQSANTILAIPNSTNFLFSSDVIFGDDAYEIAECNPITSYFKEILPQRFKVNTWTSYQFGYPTLAGYDRDKALAMLPLNDTIYTVRYSDGAVIPFVVMNLGPFLPEFAAGEEYETALNQAKEKNYINGLKGIYASKDYLILNRSSGSIIWNIKEQKGKYTLNGWKQSDDIGFPFFPIYIVESKGDNTFVCAYDADDFIQYSKSRFNHSIIKMPDSIDRITPESNGVLVTYRLK